MLWIRISICVLLSTNYLLYSFYSKVTDIKFPDNSSVPPKLTYPTYFYPLLTISIFLINK
jgi:hypothetical protein